MTFAANHKKLIRGASAVGLFALAVYVAAKVSGNSGSLWSKKNVDVDEASIGTFPGSLNDASGEELRAWLAKNGVSPPAGTSDEDLRELVRSLTSK